MRLRSRVSAGLAVAATGLVAAAIIVPRVGPTGNAAAAVTATQAAAASVVPYTPYPSTGTDLYVDGQVSPVCSDKGPGSETEPFCTIGAAASVVQPGQTVVVEPGEYNGSLMISAQGTSQASITFDAVQGAIIEGATGAPAVTVSGAHNVVLDGFSAVGSKQAFYITGGSSDVTINGGFGDGGSTTIPSVEVDGTSSDVTVSRMAIEGREPVQVDPGASGVVITGNTILGDMVKAGSVLVTDAPGTEVTGNTIHSICLGGISIAGASTGVTVENNIVQPTGFNPASPTGCAAATAISVSAGSEAGSVVDYNLIDPSGGEPLYDWGGTSYSSLADFQKETGQGAHDIAANPGLGTQQTRHTLAPGTYVFYYPLNAGSPAIDSADPNAPGELPSDQFGNPRTDDPSVANAGDGYYDRGAMELEGPTTPPEDGTAASSGPLTATWTQHLTAQWKTNGPLDVVEVTFGDDTPAEVGRVTSVTHTYSTAGLYNVGYGESEEDSDEYEATTPVVVGADYKPVSPDRILDTRNGTGTGKASPVAANGTLTLPLPAVDGVAPADMSAVVMNVTVTSPAKSGNLAVFPGSGSAPAVSNLNFSAGETVPNLVTVQVSNGEVSFRNNSGGSVQVIADLEGFYGPGGDGYQPGTPARVLDTRNGTGGKGPVAADGVLRLNLAGKVPAGTAAAVINLTVTEPAKSGNLTAYPDGAKEPIASNLNFSAGETVPNLVTVPLSNGVADIANNSGGTVQMVADLEGYFASGAPDAFVPITPTRELDTRSTGSALGAGKAITMNILTDTSQAADAMVDNVTVTQPAKAGNLIIYPTGQSRPAVSNVNFSAGETVPNLAIVKGGTSPQVSYYNNSPGPIQLIVDEYGYYMNAG